MEKSYLLMIALSLIGVMFLGCDGQRSEFQAVEALETGYTHEFTIRLLEESADPVSDYLMGFNLIYPYENEKIWQDGQVERFLREVGTTILRYPGGTVTSYYHWEALTGRGWEDSWNPENSATPEPASEFMDVDQYMELIRNTGATPLMGINITSGWLWDRMEDGINEAIALMQYCKDNDFEVIYWYLDNEPYHRTANGGIKTPREYADLINAYAGPMREFNPDIKIITNWNNAFENRRDQYEELLQIAGDQIDIIDVHYYWSWNKPTMEYWLAHTPTRLHTGDTYIEEIAYFRQMTKESGYPEMQLASLEWNVGPIREDQISTHQAALIQSELLMQFILGGMDMATFWPMHHHSTASKNRTFIEEDDISLNPVYPIFKFLGEIQGSTLIDWESSDELDHVLGLVAINDAKNEIRVSFLNKNGFNVGVRIPVSNLEGWTLKEGSTYVLTDSGSGHELRSARLTRHDEEAIAFTSHGSSITMLTFTINQ